MLWLAVTAGAICAVTGAAWVAIPEVEQLGVFLLVLALLGGSAMAAGGIWQRTAGPKSRVFVLVILAALAGGFVLANAIAIIATGESNDITSGLRVVQVASWTGAVVGGLLYVLTLVEGLTALRERDRALEATP